MQMMGFNRVKQIKINIMKKISKTKGEVIKILKIVKLALIKNLIMYKKMISVTKKPTPMLEINQVKK